MTTRQSTPVKLDRSSWGVYRVLVAGEHIGSVENNGLGSWRGHTNDGRRTHPFNTRKGAVEQLVYIQGKQA